MLIQSNAFLVAMRRCNRDFVNNSTVQVQEKISMHRSNSLAGKKRERKKVKTYEENNNVQSIYHLSTSICQSAGRGRKEQTQETCRAKT